jgi:CMP-2-keto-3-deoxyoctulosonic acid synthetase
VYEQVSKSTTLTEIVVATDNLSIENHVKKLFGLIRTK